MRWIEGIVGHCPKAQIVLYGISMGAATVMMASGEKLPPQVKAVVEDCGYCSPAEQVRYMLDFLFGLDAFPLLYATSVICRIRGGYSLFEVSAEQQLKKTSLPVLFIHGDCDRFVPFYMLQRVYNAAAGPKQMAVFNGARHGESSINEPERYRKLIADFLSQYIV